MDNDELIVKSVKSITGSLVAMIPSGLYLLTSTALAVAVINLAKKKAQVQDFYSVEMLARVDTLCIVKTGTITEGVMEVVDFIPNVKYSESDEITQSFKKNDVQNMLRVIGLSECN